MRAKAQTATALASAEEDYLAPAYYELSLEGIPVPTEAPLRAEGSFLVVPSRNAVRAFYESEKAQAAFATLCTLKFFNSWLFTMIIVANFMLILISFAQEGATSPLTVTVHVIAGLFGVAGLIFVNALKRIAKRVSRKFIALGALPVIRAFWENIDNLDEASYPDARALYSAVNRAMTSNDDPLKSYDQITRILSTDTSKNEENS